MRRRRRRRRRGGRRRRQGAGSLVERHIDSDGGERGFIWDYLTAYTHTRRHARTHTNAGKQTHADAGINKNTFSQRDERKIGALTGEVF